MKFFRNITIIIYCNNNIYFRRIFMKYENMQYRNHYLLRMSEIPSEFLLLYQI